jgi:hypothetical protein
MFGRRAQVGLFLLNLLRPASPLRYNVAIPDFHSELNMVFIGRERLGEQDQDFAMTGHVLDLRNKDGMTPGVARDLLSAPLRLNPRRRRGVPWKVVTGGAVDRPAQKALPLPRLATLALALSLTVAGPAGAGLGVLRCCGGRLRLDKYLELTKRGTSERGVRHDPKRVDWVNRDLEQRSVALRGQLVGMPYTVFSLWFRPGLESLGLTDVYRPHSPCRGGATARYWAGHPLSAVMQCGDWAPEAPYQLDIYPAEVILLRSERSWSPVVRSRMELLTSRVPGAFTLMDGRAIA